jgi:hypothetical protein
MLAYSSDKKTFLADVADNRIERDYFVSSMPVLPEYEFLIYVSIRTDVYELQ